MKSRIFSTIGVETWDIKRSFQFDRKAKQKSEVMIVPAAEFFYRSP